MKLNVPNSLHFSKLLTIRHINQSLPTAKENPARMLSCLLLFAQFPETLFNGLP
jgi:uncharacterized protein (DUF924 family)